MSLKDLARKTRTSLVDFLWRQWAQLGMAGAARSADDWVIDPEALLLFTMDAGRYDARLFDEVVGWTAANERWISLQRLKNLAESWTTDTALRGLAGFASLLNSLEKRDRWSALSKLNVPAPGEPVPFFLDADGGPMPAFGEMDPFFADAGLVKPVTVVRGLSSGIPMKARTALILRLRALLGLGPRAEVAAYLLTHGRAAVSDIARAVGYSRWQVQQTLNDLGEGGFTSVAHRGKLRSYALLDVAQWEALLGASGSVPKWVEWPRVFHTLSGLLEFLGEISAGELSEYMLASRMLTQDESMRQGLADTGLGIPFARQCDLTGVLDEFPHKVEDLLEMLDG